VPAFPKDLLDILDRSSHVGEHDCIAFVRLWMPLSDTRGAEILAPLGFFLHFSAHSGAWECVKGPSNMSAWNIWRGTFWYPEGVSDYHASRETDCAPLRMVYAPRANPVTSARGTTSDNKPALQHVVMDLVHNSLFAQSTSSQVQALLLHLDRRQHRHADMTSICCLAWIYFCVHTQLTKAWHKKMLKIVPEMIVGRQKRSVSADTDSHLPSLAFLWMSFRSVYSISSIPRSILAPLWDAVCGAPARQWTTMPQLALPTHEIVEAWMHDCGQGESAPRGLVASVTHSRLGDPAWASLLSEEWLPQLAIQIQNIGEIVHLSKWLNVPELALEQPRKDAVMRTYRRMNPSILFRSGHDDSRKGVTSMVVLVRFANYDLSSYASMEKSGVVMTHNLISVWDVSDFRLPLRETVCQEKMPWSWIQPTYRTNDHASIRGLEDVRLFDLPEFAGKGEVCFLANCCDYEGDTASQSGNCISVLFGRLHLQTQVASASKLYLPFARKRCEKNWIPIVDGDRLFIIYELLPLTVLQVDPHTLEVSLVGRVHDASCPHLHGSLRGSGKWTLMRGGAAYLGLIHEVVFVAGKRHYLHRLVHLDWQRFLAHAQSRDQPPQSIPADVVEYSLPFCFHSLAEHPIQYGIDLNLCPGGDRVLMSFSLSDDDPQFLITDRATLASEVMLPRLMDDYHEAHPPRLLTTRGRAIHKCQEFPFIFWINRDSDTDRRHEFLAELRSVHLEHHQRRITAVEPTSDRVWHFFTRGHDSVHQNDCTKALVCSHLLAIMTFFYEHPHLDMACIMEDDASFEWTDAWPFSSFSTWLSRAPSPFSILQICCHLPENEMARNITHPYFWESIMPYSTTMAYIISRQGAENVLRWAFSFPFPQLSVSDHDIYVHASTRAHPAYMFSVPLITFRNGCKSVIHAAHEDYQSECKRGIEAHMANVRTAHTRYVQLS